jgi:hypothetical protein
MRASVLALAIALLAAAPTPASAVTREEIVKLAKAGVSDDVILALVDRDKTIFALTPDDLVTLKGNGVSEAVTLAMLRSGREEGEAALAQQAAQAAAERAETAWLSPNVVVIGHGPDRPNSGHYDSPYAYHGLYSGYGNYSAWPAYSSFYSPVVRRPLCLAHTKPGPATAGVAYLTECPLQVQQSRGKLAR